MNMTKKTTKERGNTIWFLKEKKDGTCGQKSCKEKKKVGEFNRADRY